jgi:hypothetical protein
MHSIDFKYILIGVSKGKSIYEKLRRRGNYNKINLNANEEWAGFVWLRTKSEW